MATLGFKFEQMTLKETGLKKSPSIFRAALFLCIGTVLLMACKNEAPMEDPVLKEARRINYKLPFMVDEITRMDSVTVLLPDTIFQFCYTLVDQQMGSIDVPGLRVYLEPKLGLYAQDHASMAVQRKHRLTLSFLYRDKNGEFVMDIRFKPEDYIREQKSSSDSSE